LSDLSNVLMSGVEARPLPGGKVAVFLTVETSGTPDRIVSVESPAGRASLADAPQSGLPLPLGMSSLAPDAAHVIIDVADPDQTLDGALLPLTLALAEAGKVSVRARVADPAVMGQAHRMGLFGIGDICVVGDGEPAPAIELEVEPEGDGWQVQIVTEEFTFSRDLTGLYHVPGMGHGHLYVGGMKISRLYESVAVIGALPPGEHEIRVTLNTNDHRAYVVNDVPVTASATITVD
ncbi:MAG: hypothetical protein AAGL98_15060, partial [Planctomycetota bacterium]